MNIAGLLALVIRIVVLFLCVRGSYGLPAETLQERINRLWGAVEEASEPSNLSKWSKVKLAESVHALTLVDYSEVPQLRVQTLRRLSRRLLGTLKFLNSNEFRREGKSKSVGPQTSRDLFEAIVTIAPHCSVEFAQELETVIIRSRDRRIAVAGLSTLVGLVQQNPALFIPALIAGGSKERIVEKGELLEVSFKNNLAKSTTIPNRVHFQKMLHELNDALAFLRSDLKTGMPAIAVGGSGSELEGIFREALNSTEIENVETALVHLELMRNLNMLTLVELQNLQRREIASAGLRDRARQLVRREVHQRFSTLLQELPANEADAHNLLQQCVVFLQGVGLTLQEE